MDTHNAEEPGTALERLADAMALTQLRWRLGIPSFFFGGPNEVWGRESTEQLEARLRAMKEFTVMRQRWITDLGHCMAE